MSAFGLVAVVHSTFPGKICMSACRRHETVGISPLCFGLFGYFQRIIHLNAQITNGAFELLVPE